MYCYPLTITDSASRALIHYKRQQRRPDEDEDEHRAYGRSQRDGENRRQLR